MVFGMTMSSISRGVVVVDRWSILPCVDFVIDVEVVGVGIQRQD